MGGVRATSGVLTKNLRCEVAFLPALQDLNPYQRLLQSELLECGWKVRYVEGSTRALCRLAFSRARMPRTVHVHWPEPYILGSSKFRAFFKSASALCAFSIVRIRGGRLVYTLHNLANHEGRYPKIEYCFFQVFLRLTQAIFIHCHCAEKMLADRYGNFSAKKTKVVPHGHYLDAYPKKIEKFEARTILGLENQDRVFLFAGTIRPYKGVEQLVRDFENIRLPNDRLIIAGRMIGEFASMISAIEDSDCVQLIDGYVSDIELVRLLSASDVFVAPFTDVLTSGSIILAMSFGLPCIAPNIGCLPETLACQANLIYESDNPSGLKTKLSLCQNLPMSELASLGEKNHEYAMRCLSWQSIANEVSMSYEA